MVAAQWYANNSCGNRCYSQCSPVGLNFWSAACAVFPENAKEICVIKLPMEIKYSDYFIIVGGTSARHLQAMAQYAVKVHKHLKGGQTAHVHIEGKDTDDWKCIDFGNIVVHFMLPETRKVYELEKLWTLRSYDDQVAKIPPEILPTDFVYGPTADMDQKSDFKGLS
ncbi:mitochondrial assembly of ribosomal large subunit protein 1-like isoform X3 [Scyliorhinus torazame]|uniref:mitochondrial assembly of ribosomal large subunit protein 1-like isoform X3 n=1 Tax=Scyliorhinus torazame TaxID=75743 RepID=UPI003B5C5627